MEDTNKKTKKILSILFVIFIIVALGFLAWGSRDTIKKFFGFATAYDTVVDLAESEGWATGSGYAWGENIGWIDFSGTYVENDSLWGYAYGENIGWISMNCGNADTCGTVDYKVSNDGTGNLSGYAYGENVGWVDFGSSAATYQVKIVGNDFTDYAWGENIGWISFNSANGGEISYKVSTTWEPATPRRGRRTIESDTIKITNPLSGVQWITGSTSTISWLLPEATTTDTFVYMTDGGYEEKRMIAISSSTDSSIEYYVTDIDLPKNVGAGWKVAVCTGEMVGTSTDNCGFSGDFYVNSVGKKVDPIAPKATSTKTTSTTSTSSNNTEVQIELPPVKTIELPVLKIEPLKPLVELPKFGSDTFNFVPKIKSFLFVPLPESIQASLNKFSGVKDYLESLGFSKEQDLIRLNVKPLSLTPIPDPVPAGLFLVNNGSNSIRTQLVPDDTYKVVQLVRVASGTPVTITIGSYDGSAVVGEWSGQKIPFVMDGDQARLEFNSTTLGRYILTSRHAAISLAIEVYEQPKNNSQSGTQGGQSWLSRTLRLFGR